MKLKCLQKRDHVIEKQNTILISKLKVLIERYDSLNFLEIQHFEAKIQLHVFRYNAMKLNCFSET